MKYTKMCTNFTNHRSNSYRKSRRIITLFLFLSSKEEKTFDFVSRNKLSVITNRLCTFSNLQFFINLIIDVK